MATPLVVEFAKWFENECAGDIDEGSRTHSMLSEAFEAGAKIGLSEGISYGKEQAIETMRKFFETEMDNVLDALEEEIR